MHSDLLTPLGLPSPMLGWLPDETLFSLVSRYHLISGRSLASETSLALFGDVRQGTRHDFPSCIDRFVEITKELLGSSMDIIYDRTILPFYLPFRSLDTQCDAISAMRGISLGSIKYRLGILTSRFRANHPLKACADCLRADRQIHHVAYWHLMHQYPGVWVCPIHKTLLQESLLKSTGVNRFGLCLPHESILSEQSKAYRNAINLNTPNSPVLELALSSIALAKRSREFSFDSRRLVDTYIAGLKEKELCTHTGGLKLTKIGSDFAAYATAFNGINELAAMPSKPEEAANLLGRLLRMPRTGTHPLRHLMLINWLFGTLQEFWDLYCQTSLDAIIDTKCTTDSLVYQIIEKDEPNQRKMEFIDLVQLKHLSVTAASKHMGIAIGTGMAWAAEHGISTKLRPKTLHENIRTRAIELIKTGRSKKEVVAELQISEQSVTRLLRNEVGLRDGWTEAIFKNQRKQHRNIWLSNLKLHSSTGVKTLRLMIQSTYIWLYRHDREWLDKRLPKQKSRISALPRVDWDARDIQFAESVKKLGLTLITQNPGKRIPLWRIYQSLPELKAKLNQLDRMPLTVNALDELTRRRLAQEHELQ